MGLKTKTGGKAPQEALAVKYCGALTPHEAGNVVFLKGEPHLPKEKVPGPENFRERAKREATFEGRIAAFAAERLEAGAHGNMALLLKASIRGEVPMALLPDTATQLGKWLRQPQTTFALKFKAAWCGLMAAEGKVVPAYYAWYLQAKCPRNAKEALAEWLATLAPQQASQAA